MRRKWTKRKNERERERGGENNMGRWSGKDERIDGAVSYLLPAAGCVNLALGTKTRKKKNKW